MKFFNLLALSALALTVSVGAFAATPSNDNAPHGPGKMMEKIDTNKDGVVTKAESQAFHDKKFEEMDSNKDGKVSKDEMKAHHDAMKAKWEAKKAAKASDKPVE